MRVEFTQSGEFEAYYAAETWCRENGISVGQTSAMDPTGLLFGDYGWIAKWRNLTTKERAQLHGTLTGNRREGPVVITLKDEAVQAHRPSLMAPSGKTTPHLTAGHSPEQSHPDTVTTVPESQRGIHAGKLG